MSLQTTDDILVPAYLYGAEKGQVLSETTIDLISSPSASQLIADLYQKLKVEENNASKKEVRIRVECDGIVHFASVLT